MKKILKSPITYLAAALLLSNGIWVGLLGGSHYKIQELERTNASMSVRWDDLVLENRELRESGSDYFTRGVLLTDVATEMANKVSEIDDVFNDMDTLMLDYDSLMQDACYTNSGISGQYSRLGDRYVDIKARYSKIMYELGNYAEGLSGEESLGL